MILLLRISSLIGNTSSSSTRYTTIRHEDLYTPSTQPSFRQSFRLDDDDDTTTRILIHRDDDDERRDSTNATRGSSPAPQELVPTNTSEQPNPDDTIRLIENLQRETS
jgi:hypothetical protein